MRLVTFAQGAQSFPGVVTAGGRILNLAHAAAATSNSKLKLTDMISVIEAGAAGLAQIRSWLESPAPEFLVEPSSVRLLAPIPRPTQIRDCANYEKHVRQAIASAMQLRALSTADPSATLAKFRAQGLFDIPSVWYEQPLYYKGNRMSVVGPDADVVRPRFARCMDYELELGIVIAGPARDLPVEEAMSAVFGYTIYNDFSARDIQSRETQWRMGPAKGKDFDTGNAFGPCIVTRDAIPEPEQLQMIARVNGIEQVRTSSAGAQHSIAKTVAYISQCETLYPGEIIGFGTVGDGCGYERLEFLSDGDVVELEVEGIGILRNRLIAASHP
jgi:2-keto-4-pentenoate hydratase/2-oxohepta-3-ene-1,7-dioic acid hydratase in catechol pathway